MKTEQEQIEKMARSMCGYCSTDGKCAVSKNGREPDICANVDTEHCLYKEYAETLIENGYGDVSAYKAEIERLDTDFITLECNYDKIYDEHKQHKIENENLKILNNKVRECIDYLKAEVKQSQIDVLNRVMTYINDKIENDYGDMSDSVKYLTINIDDFDNFIDELIKEVQNEQKD